MSVCNVRSYGRSASFPPEKAFVHAPGNTAAGAIDQPQAFGRVRAGKGAALGPSVTRCVEVRVNGQLMALGELVQLEDRLGVELQETFQEWLSR